MIETLSTKEAKINFDFDISDFRFLNTAARQFNIGFLRNATSSSSSSSAELFTEHNQHQRRTELRLDEEQSISDDAVFARSAMTDVAATVNLFDRSSPTLAADSDEIVTWPSALQRFALWYQGVHGYLSVVVCTFGSASNVANVAVLTRPSMSTPTNVLLTGIAAADLLTMVAYLPYAVYFYCLTHLSAEYGHRRPTVIYLLFHTNFIITCHTVAMWLTVALAVFRYFAVCRSDASKVSASLTRTARLSHRRPAIAVNTSSYASLKMAGPPAVRTSSTTSSASAVDRRRSLIRKVGCQLFNRRGARLTIVGIIIATILFCIPIYRVYVPERYVVDRRSGTAVAVPASTWNETTDVTDQRLVDADAWWIGQSHTASAEVIKFNWWLYGVVLKVVPCLLMTGLGARLVVAVRAAEQHRMRLRRLSSASTRPAAASSARSTTAGGQSTPAAPPSPPQNATMSSCWHSTSAAEREHSRTTLTLIAVVLSFVATELPQGVVALLSAAIDSSIFEQIYVPLGDLWDLLILINSAVNFVLYCTMSRQYRQTFQRLFIEGPSIQLQSACRSCLLVFGSLATRTRSSPATPAAVVVVVANSGLSAAAFENGSVLATPPRAGTGSQKIRTAQLSKDTAAQDHSKICSVVVENHN